EELPFCCNGCISVFQLINSKGLKEYYKLKETGGKFQRGGPVNIKDIDYSYLDDEKFIEKYVKDVGDFYRIEFYLEGIHCISCLWLIEQLPRFMDGVQSSRLDMEKSKVTIIASKELSLARIAKEFNTLGYRPHPITESADIARLRKKEEHSLLMRIGIAGACLGNIMLLTTSLYAGLQGSIGEFFTWLSFFISLPVFFYAAVPFYRSAFASLRKLRINLDVPIVLAIVTGFISGGYSLLTGSSEVYFDSLSALIFLLLISRYLLKKAQISGLDSADLRHFFIPSTVLKKENEQFQRVHFDFVEVGDILQIPDGEVIPVDGKVTAGTGHVNMSCLTGEPYPVEVKEGDDVFSGSVNTGSTLEIKVEKLNESTKIGQILQKIQDLPTSKTEIVKLADRIAQYFLTAVILLAVGLFFYLVQTDLHDALDRAMALIIVTCPCALGLATPFALTKAMGLAMKNGIIVKNDEVFERIRKAQHLFLDKTGTLTAGSFKVVSWQEIKVPEKLKNNWHLPSVVYELERQSRHLIGRELTLKALEMGAREGEIQLTHVQEIWGKGMTGECAGLQLEMKALSDIGDGGLGGESDLSIYNNVGLYVDDELVATFKLADELRDDAVESIRSIEKMGVDSFIISGDNQHEVKKVAKILSIPDNKVFAAVSPAGKHDILEGYQKTIMVGDGANDALALKSSFVGIATQGSVEISMQVADVYMTSPGVQRVFVLMQISEDVYKVIFRNLAFSLFYNLLAATLAIAGIISPLWAAVIMPVSSITVIVSTLIGTRRMYQLQKAGLS
ncbi:MAG: heavy metal translocating P-type ATPase metal-binding domain-containing protein, partial [SAR324 cluster bacterium]|nr:heavy metal translocating P-type ATPase metal-binding domain-containing protein [SAR324 cluster bacterium]